MTRLLWHPLTAAITLMTVAVLAFALDRGGSGWPWLVLGGSAGFAISGST
ncbi:hypothetical protein JOF53_003509 [Crossiella equi]|uniref:Uncharacterized protein n=1 Tax=Crossiella equi TaxID=130796 RepID=A0ABS5ADI0_9PSEU|nr:hypothetical protein [Crossiella equi]MBP2474637.1 hypothetical protein [Crossiella equi]